MRAIELTFDDDCPNVDAARENLAAALAQLGLPPVWQEWRRDDPATPEHARRVGSPAVLVAGLDVEGHETQGRACCRVYVGVDGRRSGAPPVDAIVRALVRSP